MVFSADKLFLTAYFECPGLVRGGQDADGYARFQCNAVRCE